VVTFFSAITSVYFDVRFYISANKSKSFRFLVYYLLLILYGCGFVLETFRKQKIGYAFMPRKFIDVEKNP
jgi:hypothetical protein